MPALVVVTISNWHAHLQLEIRENIGGSYDVQKLVKKSVTNTDEAMQYLFAGSSMRKIAHTAMNTASRATTMDNQEALIIQMNALLLSKGLINVAQPGFSCINNQNPH